MTQLAPEVPKLPVPPTPPVRKLWSPWVAVTYAVFIYFAAQFVGGLLLYLYALAHGWNQARIEAWLDGSVVAQFWYVLLFEALTFGAIWWFIRFYGAKLGVLGWKRLRWSDTGKALIAYAVYFVGYYMLYRLVTYALPGINVDQKQELGFDHVSGGISLFLAFVSLVVLPPLVEETVFRGFVFTGLRNKLRPVHAALITSLLFAVAHLQLGSGQPPLWIASLDTFYLSLVLCYLRQTTSSLWPGVFVHALKNGLAFASVFLLPHL